VAAFLPSKRNGKFLKTFVGPVNVRVARKEDKLRVKDEYNNYRVDFRCFFDNFFLESLCIYFGYDFLDQFNKAICTFYYFYFDDLSILNFQ
jgi:hypothetical protein